MSTLPVPTQGEVDAVLNASWFARYRKAVVWFAGVLTTLIPLLLAQTDVIPDGWGRWLTLALTVATLVAGVQTPNAITKAQAAALKTLTPVAVVTAPADDEPGKHEAPGN